MEQPAHSFKVLLWSECGTNRTQIPLAYRVPKHTILSQIPLLVSNYFYSLLLHHVKELPVAQASCFWFVIITPKEANPSNPEHSLKFDQASGSLTSSHYSILNKSKKNRGATGIRTLDPCLAKAVL